MAWSLRIGASLARELGHWRRLALDERRDKKLTQLGYRIVRHDVVVC